MHFSLGNKSETPSDTHRKKKKNSLIWYIDGEGAYVYLVCINLKVFEARLGDLTPVIPALCETKAGRS